MLSALTECVVEDALGPKDHRSEEYARLTQRHECPGVIYVMVKT